MSLTVAQMRELLGLAPDVPDSEVVQSYGAWLNNEEGAISGVEPLTLDDAKAHLRVLDDSEDGLIGQKLEDAIEWVEGRTGHILRRRTIVEHFSSFDRLRLDAWPIVSIDEVEYVGADYLTGLLTADDLALQLRVRPARVKLRRGVATPALDDGDDAITIRATAGYEPGAVPGRLRQAVLLILAGLYADRETGGMAGDVERAAASLCARFERVTV